ncbi:hypothetical protein RN001_005856 [Aquatica leii]|uniref:Uncharacterized protein n=1 Tax=Aquatica leii TaxID=1421715 RepID=A0AAN7PCD9_9COLE|nr:hypothetical protein RN001_005856 [Aquatica leii]
MDLSELENSDLSDIDPDFEYDSAADVSDDSDESDFSNSESDDNIPPVQFGDWKIVGNPFQDKRETVIYEKNFQYDVHPGLNLNEPKTPKECFEAFVLPNTVRNEHHGGYEAENLEMSSESIQKASNINSNQSANVKEIDHSNENLAGPPQGYRKYESRKQHHQDLKQRCLQK